MDFNDLARSGTAPEPSKVKGNQMAGQTLSLRPKTRSADNDMQDFRIELRTNKFSYQSKNYTNDTAFDNGAADNQSDEFIRAMESYQADFESWSRGRTDYDPNGASSPNARQGTAVGGRRSAKDGKKVQSSALSAYTQNIPQIVLQTSKKPPKAISASSPRSTREQKTDVKADIRAVYGADYMDRGSVSGQRPRSQKQSGTSSPISPKPTQAFTFPEESIISSSERQEFVSTSQSSDFEQSHTKSAPSSASRLRANVAQNAANMSAANTNTATTVIKPFSIRKAAPSTSSGPRPTTRPFSHTEGVRTSVSQGATAGTPAPRPSLDTPTSSSSSKRVTRKSATNAGNPSGSLLKSSLVPGTSTRSASGRGERSTSKDSESDGTDYIENDSNTDFSDTSEYIAKQRAADASARKHTQDAHGHGQPAAPIGIAASVNIVKFQSSSTSSDNRDNKPPLSGKSPVKDTTAKRAYSQSPTLYLDGLNLGKVDSDQALLDIIQDTDNLECSFDESPILAAYLQQKSHTSHAASQQQEPSVSESSTRPQSRKLYLGAEKEAASNTAFSPKENKTSSYKTAPRSAGARYPVPHAPKTTTSSNGETGTSSSSMIDGPAPPLRKMSSFNEIIPQSRKWHEIPPSNNLPDQRPPSRQSSAFPVHLADEPSGNKALSARTDENKLSKRTSSPTTTAKGGIASPPVRPSMRWDQVDLGEDEDYEGEIEEALHQDDTLSDTGSVDENPTKFSGKSNYSSNSAKNNAPTSTRASPTQIGQALGSQSPAGHQAVAPARTHIGIVRSAPPTEDRPDTAVGADLYAPEYATIQRPPSRQKIAAQHLFEGGPPPPSRAGTVTADASRGSRAVTAGNPVSEAQPMSRSTTRPSTSHYNPRDDGFTELDTDEAAAVPFVIKFNSSEANDFEEFDLDELALSPSRSQIQYDRDSMPRRKSQNNASGHSRSPSNTSNNWADLVDDGLSHQHGSTSPGYRPQTIGGSAKAPRLLGVIPPSSLAPPRTKSAGEGLRSPGIPLRREGNNYLLAQQPHAPAGGVLQSRGAAAGYGTHVLRENIKAGLGDYTAGPPPNRALNSGWTEASHSHVSPRAQVSFKIFDYTIQN